MSEGVVFTKPYIEALLKSLGDLVIVIDENHKFLFAHGKEEDFLIPPPAFLGKKADEVLPPKLLNLYYNAYEKNKNGFTVEFQYDVILKGEKKIFKATQSPIFVDGEFRGTVVVVKDVTESQKIKEEMEKLETKYRELFERIPVGITVTRFDTGEIVECNSFAKNRLGYKNGDCKKINIKQIYVNPHDRDRLIAQLLAKGETALDIELKKKTGDRIWIRTFSRLSKREDGRLYVESVCQDITKHIELEENLKKSLSKIGVLFKDVVVSFSKVMGFRDPYTANHQQRVAHLSYMIGKKLGLSVEQLHGLVVAAMLHDVGKLSVPPDILSKPQKLTKLEYELIKQHPIAGYEILSEIDFPWPVAEIVLQHHERLDGSGYPQGLKGDQIRLEAKIIAVADVVEAMSSHRPYRPALGIDKALEEIERNKGKLYDPEAVEACVNLFREGFKFEEAYRLIDLDTLFADIKV